MTAQRPFERVSRQKLGLSVVAEILYWFSRTSKVCRQPSIKLLEASLKSGFAVSRFPGLQIACSDEVFLPDLHYWNVIFLNDSAEMAWRIARLKGRTRNIDEALARLALHCLWAHGILRAPQVCKQSSKLLRTHRVLIPQSGVLK